MWGKFWLAFVVALTVGVIVLTVEVDAQSTVDEGAYCESSTLDKVVNLIGEGLRDVKLVKEELKDVKNTLGSNEHRDNGSCVSMKQGLEDLKTAVESSQQQTNASCVSKQDLNQVVNLITAGLEDVKNRLESNHQHNTSCSPSQQQSPSTDSAARKQMFASALEYNCIPMLIQQNINASSTFNRSWAEYKAGFNDTRGNYWLGNDLLSQLTQSGRYKLRFDLQHRNGSWYWAEYSSFVVLNEIYNYKLQVSGYSSNTGYDSLSYHNQVPFSTYDRDHNLATHNCAAKYGGGFWYKYCYQCGVNNSRGRNDFRYSLTNSLSLQKSRMWLTC